MIHKSPKNTSSSLFNTASFLFILTTLLVSALPLRLSSQTFTGKPRYQIEIRRADTVLGEVIVEMFPAIAPNSVRNWDSLVNIHFYDSTAFHRVIPAFMIQGGDPNSRSGPRSTWGYGDPSHQTVDAEFNAVSHLRSIISAARSNDPNSASSQFFICVTNDNYLDWQYSVYGHVVDGMSVVDKVVNAPRDANDNPLVKISMFITRTGSNDSLETAPALSSPVDGFSTGTSTKATLKWKLVSDAMMYEVQLATDSAFSNIVFDSTYNQTATSATVSKLKLGTMYYWHMRANNGGHASDFSPAWKFSAGTLGVAETQPAEMELDEASPNPSKGSTLIRFHTSKDGPVRLVVRDILGREMLRLLDANLLANGDHEVTIPSGSLLPGIYFYRLESGNETLSKRLVVE